MKNRRGFNPDARVEDAAFAFRVLSDSVFTKGFLGPSLRENNGLPSVGVSAARRAGVNIGDDGKMRCPPGTPNANQFTDINMSNCMVPSAETVARNAAEVAAKLASRTTDGFKRGKHTKNKKDRNIIPDAEVGFANPDGFLEQRRVSIGNSVFSPIDGSQRIISSKTDAVEHVFNGGSLKDIPDEFVLSSIMENIGEGKRFREIGSGGGMHGMLRLEDGKTGALIGVKYPQGNDGFGQNPGSGYVEASSEAMGEILSEHMGYEPNPMRIVTTELGGLALVSELAHNRSGTIESARLAARDGAGYNYDLDSKQVLRMGLLDSILGNGDRHEGNFLIGVIDDERTLIPIDNSRGFLNTTPSRGIEAQFITATGVRDILDDNHSTDEGFQEMVNIVAEIQEELRSIDTEQMRQQMLQVVSHIGSFGFGHKAEDRTKAIDSAISRLESFKNASADDLAEGILPKYSREYTLKMKLSQEEAKNQEVIDAFDAIFDEPTDKKPSVV